MKENSTIIELTMTCSKKGRKSTKMLYLCSNKLKTTTHTVHQTSAIPDLTLKLGQMRS